MATKMNEINALARVEIKSNTNLVIWQVQSESGHIYNVSLLDGRVSGCCDTTGQECKGWQYRHSCHHATLAQAREDRHQAEDGLRFSPWHGSNYGAERPIEERGLLNGSHAFSLLR